MSNTPVSAGPQDDSDLFFSYPASYKNPIWEKQDALVLQAERDLRQYVLDHEGRFPQLALRIRSNDPASVKPMDFDLTPEDDDDQPASGFPTLGDLCVEDDCLRLRFKFLVDLAYADADFLPKEDGEEARKRLAEMNQV